MLKKTPLKVQNVPVKKQQNLFGVNPDEKLRKIKVLD